MPESVQTLTTAIASGDAEAFGVFYRQWFDRMFAMARHAAARDEPTCMDIVHDAMLKVIRSLRPMPTEEDLHRWLQRVVKSCALDRLRAESRRRSREQAANAPRTGDPIDDDDLNDRIQWLCRELAEMKDADAGLLVMRHRFGWTLRQIGESLGLAPGAVDGRINRMLLALRRKATETFHE